MAQIGNGGGVSGCWESCWKSVGFAYAMSVDSWEKSFGNDVGKE